MLKGKERTTGYAECEADRLRSSCKLRKMSENGGQDVRRPLDLKIRITVTAQSIGKTDSARTTVIFRTTLLE